MRQLGGHAVVSRLLGVRGAGGAADRIRAGAVAPFAQARRRGMTSTMSNIKLSLRAVLAAAVIVLAVVIAWWWLIGRGPEVRVVIPTRGDAARVVYATGRVEPVYWAKVSALKRKRIIDICKCEGKAVTKGDVLARLDDVEERAILRELKARHARLQQDADRLKQLYERNVVSRTSYEDKLTLVREYGARIAAQADRLDDLQLKAPMDGIVLRRDGEVGEIAGTGANDVLFWVGRPRPLRVTAEVNEEDIAVVQTGMRVLLRHDGFEGQSLRARVDEITPKGDPTTKTFRVYFALPDNTPLKIGMSVEANIIVREVTNALLVPTEAVSDGVLQTIRDGRVRRLPVALGIRGTRKVEILSELPSKLVILSPARADLAEGARVRPRLASGR